MDAEEAIEVIKTARPDLRRVVKVSEVSTSLSLHGGYAG